MTTPVSQAATAFDLSGVRTGKPVVSAGLTRWSSDLSFLLGHNLHVCGGATILERPAGHTSLVGLLFSVVVPYARSPGAQVVRVSVELAPSDDDDTQTIVTTLPTGAVWIDAAGLDGSVNFPIPPLGRASGEEFVGWVDVSAVTVGDLSLSFAFKGTPTGSKAPGIRRCQVVEVPLSALDNVGTEPVLNASGLRPGRLVIDGSAATVNGTQRVFELLDQARGGMRQHFCLSGVESADANVAAQTPHWHREANSYGALAWLHPTGTRDPSWYLTPRNLYGTTASTAWRFVVRYRTSNGTTCGVKLYAEGGSIDAATHTWVPAGAAVAQTLSLSGTSGVWSWASNNVTLPGDGTDRLVKVWFEAKGPGAGQLLSLSCLGLIEKEP